MYNQETLAIVQKEFPIDEVWRPRSSCYLKNVYLSKKLTMFGFFSSFITRISLMISSFLGCFCRLICLMATWETRHALQWWECGKTKKNKSISFALPPVQWRRRWRWTRFPKLCGQKPLLLSIQWTWTCCAKLSDLPLSDLLVSCIFLFWISNTDDGSCRRTSRGRVIWVSLKTWNCAKNYV